MGEIIQFKRPKEVEYPTMPTPEEIAIMLLACEKEYEGLEYVVNNGEYWKEVFEQCMEHAESIEMNPWDVLATIINRMCGVRFFIDEEGNGCVDVI